MLRKQALPSQLLQGKGRRGYRTVDNTLDNSSEVREQAAQVCAAHMADSNEHSNLWQPCWSSTGAYMLSQQENNNQKDNSAEHGQHALYRQQACQWSSRLEAGFRLTAFRREVQDFTSLETANSTCARCVEIRKSLQVYISFFFPDVFLPCDATQCRTDDWAQLDQIT